MAETSPDLVLPAAGRQVRSSFGCCVFYPLYLPSICYGHRRTAKKSSQPHLASCQRCPPSLSLHLALLIRVVDEHGGTFDSSLFQFPREWDVVLTDSLASEVPPATQPAIG